MGPAKRPPLPPDLYRPARAPGGRRENSHPVAAWLGRVALRATGVLPYRVIYHVGWILGVLGARLPSQSVRNTRINLRLCFPGLTDRERTRLCRASVIEGFRAFVELSVLWTASSRRVLRLVREVDGEDHLTSAVARGRGVIVAAPHLGSWEFGALYCSSRLGLTSLYTPPIDSALDQFVLRGRERFGGRLVHASVGGTRTLLRALRRGEVVGLMPDQDPGPGAGVFVPFFGVPAATTTLVTRLAGSTGASVVFAYAERLPAGAGFCLHFRPPSAAICDEDLLVATTALNADIERLVRERPEQYLWSYKRFRMQPADGANPYRQVSHAS